MCAGNVVSDERVETVAEEPVFLPLNQGILDAQHPERTCMARKVFTGECIGPGRATGTLVCVEPVSRTPRQDESSEDFSPDQEYERFRDHAADLSDEMREISEELRDDAMHQEAEIFNAHAAILEDEEFHDRVHGAIQHMEVAAEEAVRKVLGDMAKMMEETEDPVFTERAADFRDLEDQLCRRLAGQADVFLAQRLKGVDDPILALKELTPSLVIKAQRLGVKGYVVEEGTGYSHGSVLAKSFDECVLRIPSLEAIRSCEGDHLLLDAVSGEILIDPSEEELEDRPWPLASPEPEGPWRRLIRMWINILGPEQVEGFDWAGIEGVGLYRTETLFMEKEREFPTEEEQIETYSAIFDRCPGKVVTVRTLDIGGDKPIAYLSLGPQENPELGLRAHRLYHFHPEILITQIRAILRAAVGRENLRIMYPMIESLDQWEFVQGLTDHAIEILRKDGLEFQSEFERGILIETPSAVWSFAELAEAADFASVGTNDLVQYMFAADRSSASVASMYSSEHPIILQILRSLVEQAEDAGIPLSICGEMAADFRALPLLIGIGLRDVSVSPRAVPILEHRLQDYDLDECKELAQRCLECRRASEVGKILDDWQGVPESSEVPPEREIFDPVCKQKVDPDSTPHVVSIGGVRYYFCSGRCERIFTRSSSYRSDSTSSAN